MTTHRADEWRSLPDGIGQVLDMYLREKAGEQAVNEEKSNGNGGSVGHKIEEESEAAFDYQPLKIGDLCPDRRERLLLCAAKRPW